MKSFAKILVLTILLAITIDSVTSCDCQGFSTLINEFKTIRAECTHLCKYLSRLPQKIQRERYLPLLSSNPQYCFEPEKVVQNVGDIVSDQTKETVVEVNEDNTVAKNQVLGCCAASKELQSGSTEATNPVEECADLSDEFPTAIFGVNKSMKDGAKIFKDYVYPLVLTIKSNTNYIQDEAGCALRLDWNTFTTEQKATLKKDLIAAFQNLYSYDEVINRRSTGCLNKLQYVSKCTQGTANGDLIQSALPQTTTGTRLLQTTADLSVNDKFSICNQEKSKIDECVADFNKCFCIFDNSLISKRVSAKNGLRFLQNQVAQCAEAFVINYNKKCMDASTQKQLIKKECKVDQAPGLDQQVQETQKNVNFMPQKPPQGGNQQGQPQGGNQQGQPQGGNQQGQPQGGNQQGQPQGGNQQGQTQPQTGSQQNSTTKPTRILQSSTQNNQAGITNLSGQNVSQSVEQLKQLPFCNDPCPCTSSGVKNTSIGQIDKHEYIKMAEDQLNSIQQQATTGQAKRNNQATNGTAQSPQSGTQQAPPSGTQQAPPSGTQQAPPSGTQQAPPSGTQQAPPSGTQQAPPSSTQQAPPSGTQQAPPSGTQPQQGGSESKNTGTQQEGNKPAPAGPQIASKGDGQQCIPCPKCSDPSNMTNIPQTVRDSFSQLSDTGKQTLNQLNIGPPVFEEKPPARVEDNCIPHDKEGNAIMFNSNCAENIKVCLNLYKQTYDAAETIIDDLLDQEKCRYNKKPSCLQIFGQLKSSMDPKKVCSPNSLCAYELSISNGVFSANCKRGTCNEQVTSEQISMVNTQFSSLMKEILQCKVLIFGNPSGAPCMIAHRSYTENRPDCHARAKDCGDEELKGCEMRTDVKDSTYQPPMNFSSSARKPSRTLSREGDVPQNVTCPKLPNTCTEVLKEKVPQPENLFQNVNPIDFATPLEYLNSENEEISNTGIELAMEILFSPGQRRLSDMRGVSRNFRDLSGQTSRRILNSKEVRNRTFEAETEANYNNRMLQSSYITQVQNTSIDTKLDSSIAIDGATPTNVPTSSSVANLVGDIIKTIDSKCVSISITLLLSLLLL